MTDYDDLTIASRQKIDKAIRDLLMVHRFQTMFRAMFFMNVIWLVILTLVGHRVLMAVDAVLLAISGVGTVWAIGARVNAIETGEVPSVSSQ